MSAHAILAPSSAEQWANCSGSVMAQVGRPDPSTEQTREGEAAHWVMEGCLIGWRDRGEVVPTTEYVGRGAPNGVLIDAKMADGAAAIVDDVLSVVAGHEDARLFIEHRVRMPDIHADNWGTLDVAALVGRKLYIWDYKHGHRTVRAAGNLQLADYANGLLHELGINGHDEQALALSLRIVQPFAYHSPGGPIDEWTGRASDLRPIWNRLHAAAFEVVSRPTLTAGRWCRDCLAVWDCPGAREYVYAMMDVSQRPYAMDAMTAADLATEREVLQDGLAVAKKRLEAIEDQLQHAITSGDMSSGLTVETVPGREEWSILPEQAAALAAQFGVSIAVPTVKTPAQTRQAAPVAVRPLLAETIKQFTRRKAGSLKLTPIADSITAKAFQRR